MLMYKYYDLFVTKLLILIIIRLNVQMNNLMVIKKFIICKLFYLISGLFFVN